MGARKLDAKILDLGRNCFLLRDFFGHDNHCRYVFKLVRLVLVKFFFRPVRIKGALVDKLKAFRHALHSVNKARLLRFGRLRLVVNLRLAFSVVGVGLRVGDAGGINRFVHFLDASGHSVVKLFGLYADAFHFFVFGIFAVAGANVLAKNVGEQVVGAARFLGFAIGFRGFAGAFVRGFFFRRLFFRRVNVV